MIIDISQWKEFLVKDLFEIINGKGITQDEIDENPGSFPAVQSGEDGLGVMGYIDYDYCIAKKYSLTTKPCLTVARSGTAGFVSFHPHGCVVGDSAKILLLKETVDRPEEVYLFLSVLLNKNRYKYSYGRKVTLEGYRKTTLLLPVNAQGHPDWAYMADYIANIENRERKKVLSVLGNR